MASSQPGCLCQSLRSSNKWMPAWTDCTSFRLVSCLESEPKWPGMAVTCWHGENCIWIKTFTNSLWHRFWVKGRFRRFIAFGMIMMESLFMLTSAFVQAGCQTVRRSCNVPRFEHGSALWALHSKETTVTFGHEQFVTFMNATSSGNNQPLAPFGHSKAMWPPWLSTISATSKKCLSKTRDKSCLFFNFFAKDFPYLAILTLCHFDQGSHGSEPHKSQPGNLFTSFFKDSTSWGFVKSVISLLNLKWFILRSALTYPNVDSLEQQNSNIVGWWFLAFFRAWEWSTVSTWGNIACNDSFWSIEVPSIMSSAASTPLERNLWFFAFAAAAWIVARLSSNLFDGTNHVRPVQLREQILWHGLTCQSSWWVETLFLQRHSVICFEPISLALKGQSFPTGANNLFLGLTWTLHHAHFSLSNSQ